MKYISVVLRSVLIISLFSVIVKGITSHEKPEPSGQTLKAIKDCITSSPDPWPEQWKKEYIDTISNAVESHRNASHYALRLEILRKGFVPYWRSFIKTPERSLFELHCARIRWYIEHLMVSEFPSEQERQKLRDQYTDIWDYAAGSLLVQFPFLDPNTVEAAKADDLSICYRKIDAPLMPVYLKPMSEEEVEQIKQCWDNLRYARIDLWRRLGGGLKTLSEKNNTKATSNEHDYELTKESLSQLLGLVWKVVPQRPDYYLNALENRNKALKYRLQLKRQARNCVKLAQTR